MARWENEHNTGARIRQLKRDAVLREAAHAFGRHGYHNTSLDDVARALNISKGTLYNYVKDKQEILFECHKEALDIGDAAVAHAAGVTSSGGDQLRVSMLYYLEHLVEQLGACAALMDVDALRPADREAAVHRRAAFERWFVETVERGMADGSLRSDLNPRIVLVTFMGASNWIPRWYKPEGDLTPREVAEQLVDVLMGGVVPANLTARAVSSP